MTTKAKRKKKKKKKKTMSSATHRALAGDPEDFRVAEDSPDNPGIANAWDTSGQREAFDSEANIFKCSDEIPDVRDRIVVHKGKAQDAIAAVRVWDAESCEQPGS